MTQEKTTIANANSINQQGAGRSSLYLNRQPDSYDTDVIVEPKLVVWDIDDIVWDSQGRISERLNIPFQDLVEFHILENERLTIEQREAVNACYQDCVFYRDIKFYPGFERIMELEQYGARLQFNSNQFSLEVAEDKKQQIRAILPDARPEIFHFNIIDGATTIKKKFPDDSFIVIDDSPYNIARSPAPHNIMPIVPWTQTAKAQAMVAHQNVYYVPQGDLEAIYRLVRHILLTS